MGMNELLRSNVVGSLFGRLNRVSILLAAVSLSALTVTAQPFRNMDFEVAGTRTIPQDSVWLSWQLAAPGWQHAAGADTFFVYHQLPEQRQTQGYFLVDSHSAGWSPLAGNYSFGLASGYYSSTSANSTWVPASISQQAVVPGDARSFSLLAEGDFSVSIGSTRIPMSRVEGNLYSGDISAFAGELVTLNIANESLNPQAAVILDNMTFSATAVPEPGTVLLIPAGILCLVAAARRNRSRA
jgi:hypothetical protein